ncbi:MAG TPA: tetratricopeptide repeat protein [Pyrinomonadaceae bacterium]|nr:tetratricopeptide repeat protein [Pyrinomonadaceae bacterium]
MLHRSFILLLGIICWTSQAANAQTPGLAVRYYELGHEKLKVGDWHGAVEDFTRAIELDAQLQAPKNSQRYDGSQTDSSEVYVSDPFTAAAYHSRAIAHANLSELNEAIDDYQHALRIRPKWAEAYLGLGFVLLDKKDFAGAIDDFSRAIKIKPALVTAHHARGTAFMKQGRMEPAVIDFTSALKLDPRMAEAYANRGLALMVLGRETEAKTDINKCLELRPELKKDLEGRIDLARKLMVQGGGLVSNN